MNRNVIILILIILVGTLPGYAQTSQRTGSSQDNSANSGSNENPCIIHERKSTSWKLTPTLGDIVTAQADTSYLNFYNLDIQDSYTVSNNYLGNLGTPGESRIFLDREERPEFMFLRGYQRFNTTPGKHVYYNTLMPFTIASYLTGGSKQNAEDRLLATFAGNVNKKIGFGLDLDYLYTRGFYNFQGVNTLNWQASAYYMTDKYSITGYANTSSFSNQENGGISDLDYILYPERVNENLSSPKNIPTNLQYAWNKVKHKDYYITQRYNIGFDREIFDAEGDSTGLTEFIPVTSFIHTLHFQRNFRRFRINEGGILTEDFFENTYMDSVMTNDHLSYWNLKNTIGVSLNEGFNKYAKLGLAAFATLENRSYTNMQDAADMNFIPRHHTTNIIWLGGELYKRQGKIFTYNANGKFGLSGDALGDIDINAEMKTKIPLTRDSITVRAFGYFKNSEPSYYLKHYFSNHFKWDNESFSKERKVRVGGEFRVPVTRTGLTVGVENLTNFIYFNQDGLPMQHSDNIQVLSAEIQQGVKAGIFNWNNSVVVQKSTDSNILPLPTVSLYSQMYLNFRIARVLYTQLGLDCHYFTKYYSPLYQPATQIFHNQNTDKVGNYPLVNVFANLKLKDVKFFVMMYHVNQGLFGDNHYFLAPAYPMNPRFFKMGISIDFNN